MKIVELDLLLNMMHCTWCCWTGRQISCWDLLCGVAVFLFFFPSCDFLATFFILGFNLSIEYCTFDHNGIKHEIIFLLHKIFLDHFLWGFCTSSSTYLGSFQADKITYAFIYRPHPVKPMSTSEIQSTHAMKEIKVRDSAAGKIKVL